VWPRLVIALVCACALGAPLTAGADSQAQTQLSPGLLDAARTNPDSEFNVIVQGETALGRSFDIVPAVATTLTGNEIVSLAEGSEPLVITRDTPVAAADEPSPPDTAPSENTEPTVPVPARPPSMVSPPSILGTPEEGQTLTAANGSWDGTQPLVFRHHWQRCDAGGEACVDIVGATAPSYMLAAADVGATIRFAVAAHGLGGEAFARTEPSTVVTAIPELLPRFKQHWPYAAGVTRLLTSSQSPALQPPTIAIVDSGIDAARPDFGSRVIERVTVSSRSGNQPGDGNGHGTAVASVAAGEADGYTGAARRRNSWTSTCWTTRARRT
jgi:subtilisin family serine protease